MSKCTKSSGLATAREARVEWRSPSDSSAGSLPLGNGDIGMNVWQDANGDVAFYISKSDAWDSHGELIKVGLVRICVDSEDFRRNAILNWNPDEGCAYIRTEDKGISLRIRVDANQPCVVVDFKAEEACRAEAFLDPWRCETSETHPLPDSPGGYVDSNRDVVITGDTERLIWYQRNESSIWKELLEQQHLTDYQSQGKDPLKHLTFGACMTGDGWGKVSDERLSMSARASQSRLVISVHSAQVYDVEAFIKGLVEVHQKATRGDANCLWQEHLVWWRSFWERSWIRLSGFAEAPAVNQAYVWQRFMLACCGRGKHPIKFNGALFTADWDLPSSRSPNGRKEPIHADYRRWGGPYWFQNTRLMYWAMLGAGDYEMMLPLFRMYREMLDFAKFRTKKWYNHAGANFFETSYFFGLLRPKDYGFERGELPDGTIQEQYIKYYWSSGLELIVLMESYFRATGDASFLNEILLPIAREVLAFYCEHYSESGSLVFEPTQSLEQYHNVRNPLPIVVGIQAVVGFLLGLQSEHISNHEREMWKEILNQLPDIPLEFIDGDAYLSAAENLNDPTPMNFENPELYAVFPYKWCGITQGDLELGVRSFGRRVYKGAGGWRQDAIQAACLGLAKDAANAIKAIAAESCSYARFKGFRGPNMDWIPDMDHASVLMSALQMMICQTNGDKAYLLSAWPDDWKVEFKCPLSEQAFLVGEVEDNHEVKYELIDETERWSVFLDAKFND